MKINLKFSFIFCFMITLNLSCKKSDQVMNPPEGKLCQPNIEEQVIIEQLQKLFAYDFGEVDPSIEDNQLAPLIDYLGDTKIIGLGEGTHGTHEFYQLKDKIFRALVLQKGFKAIIFEIPWGNALVVNDFVLYGIGTADEVINQTFYWTYDTKEVRELVQWMHDYNLSQIDADKIHFLGCDPQGPDFQIEKRIVFNYLFAIYPDSNSFLTNNYIHLPNKDLSSYWQRTDSIHQINILGLKKVLDYFVSNETELIERSSPFEYEVALMAAHVIQQRERIYRIQNFGILRDSLMAVYSEWWQHILGEDSKVAIWAHNLHVMDGDAFGSDFMGTYLRNNNHEQYKNVGFSFGKGSLNAFLAGANREVLEGVQRQTLLQTSCPTTNFLLTRVEGPQHYYIFDEFEGKSQEYFSSPQPFMQCGAGFNPKFVTNYIRNFPLSKTFDVLIHFDETTASLLE